MQVKKLEKLQKHLKTLHLIRTKIRDRFGDVENNMSLPETKQDTTRFSINNWEFNCGMPACVAGHAKLIFNWKDFSGDFESKFRKFFDLSYGETDWITSIDVYESINPTPKTAAKHIQDVLNGKFKEKTNGKSNN